MKTDKMKTKEFVLHSVYGYNEFRKPQDAIIQDVIDGRDVLVLMPTGGGKSLCYQIPSLVRDGTGIIISPLLSLMEDQVSALKQRHVKAETLSSNNYEDNPRIQRAFLNGELDMLYVSPERFVNDDFQNMMRRAKVSLIAIDEAHCISQWGHDFRPKYVEMGEIIKSWDVPRIAVTATADAQTKKDIMKLLSISNVYTNSFDRPNIEYKILPRKKTDLISVLNNVSGTGIVYCSTRESVSTTYAFLKQNHFNVAIYHAGLTTEEKRYNLHKFLNEETIMVATVAFGMGIDKPDVRFVIHAELPASVEAYYQETGRAGRDGMPSVVITLYGLDDVVKKTRLIEQGNDNARKAVNAQKFNALVNVMESTSCRRNVILKYFGEYKEEGCGKCDRCLNPVKYMDVTSDAYRILQCIQEIGTRHPTNYVVAVMMGDVNQEIKDNRHHTLQSHGSGRNKGRDHWKYIIRKMSEYITFNGGLALTDKAKDFMAGKIHMIQIPVEDEAPKMQELQPKLDIPRDKEKLWTELKSIRKTIAEEQHVPLHIILNDKEMYDLVIQMPTSIDVLSELIGYGKATEYNHLVIPAIQRYKEMLDENKKRNIIQLPFGRKP